MFFSAVVVGKMNMKDLIYQMKCSLRIDLSSLTFDPIDLDLEAEVTISSIHVEGTLGYIYPRV